MTIRAPLTPMEKALAIAGRALATVAASVPSQRPSPAREFEEPDEMSSGERTPARRPGDIRSKRRANCSNAPESSHEHDVPRRVHGTHRI